MEEQFVASVCRPTACLSSKKPKKQNPSCRPICRGGSGGGGATFTWEGGGGGAGMRDLNPLVALVQLAVTALRC